MKVRSCLIVVAILSVGLVSVVPSVGADAQEESSGYAQHGPVACVDGVLLSSYAGRAYDASGVTGAGTVGSPYELVGVQINTTAFAEYPEAVLLLNCPHFRLTEVQLYGSIERAVQMCYPGVSEEESVNFGVTVTNSGDVVIDNSVFKYARIASVNVSGPASSVVVTRSDIKANFGAGLWVRDHAVLNVTESFIAYNGYTTPDRVDPMREYYWEYPVPGGPWPPGSDYFPVSNWAVGLWADTGAYLEAWNNTMFENKNHWVIDQTVDVSTDGVLNAMTLENVGGGFDAMVLEHGVVPQRERQDPMACGNGDRVPFWTNWSHWGPEPRASASMGTYPGYVASMVEDEVEGLVLRTPVGSQYDAWTDPIVAEGRFTFWGNSQGPNLAEGPIDTLAWLFHRPPYALLAGAARSQGQEGTLRDVGMTIEHATPKL